MAYPGAIKETLQAELESIREKGIFKEERFIHSPQSSRIEVEFPAGSEVKEVINLCSNNYLGLSSHPEVIAAAHEGLDQARLRHVQRALHLRHPGHPPRAGEQRLTEFLGTEDTILFPSCLDANAGIFEAVLGPEDVMISDRLVHASIIDGIRLCKAQRDTYKHANMATPGAEARGAPGQARADDRHRRRVQHGRRPGPDGPICELAEKYDAMVFVDECHASGFIGKTGRGTPSTSACWARST